LYNKDECSEGEYRRRGRGRKSTQYHITHTAFKLGSLKLISMNKDSAFELVTFVTLPEKRGTEVSVHDFVNSLRDSLARASDYH